MKKVLLTILLVLCASPAWAWTNVQNAANATGATGSSRAVTISSSGSGHEICMGVVAQNSSGGAPTISSVTDNKSGGSSTYTQVVTFSHAGDNQTIAIFCTLNSASGITSVTATMSANVTSFLDAYVSEYNPTASLTVTIGTETATNNGSSTAAATGSITPSGTDNLVLALAQAPSVSAVNNSFNLRSSADGNGWADKLGVGSVATTVTFTTTSGGWFTVIGNLKGVSSGSSPTAIPVVY